MLGACVKQQPSSIASSVRNIARETTASSGGAAAAAAVEAATVEAAAAALRVASVACVSRCKKV